MPRLASVPNLDQELDRLYGVPPEEFVKERDALAARLRQAHQAEAAAAVAKLRKPLAVAWAVNRLAREEPQAVAALLDAAERLRKAQERALGGAGGAPDVAQAAADERDRVRDLVAAARRLDPPVPAAAVERLGQTLRAAAAGDAETRELLEHGRLTGEVQAAGFEALEGVKVAPRRSARPRRNDAAAAAAARERLKELRAEARKLAAAARAAERAAATAERAASTLRAEADATEEAAQRAADEVAAAESELRKRS